jgi:hypothetical protein
MLLIIFWRFKMNKKIWLGMLVLALVLGMTVIGCEDATDRSAPSSLTLSVYGTSWDTSVPTTGEVKLMFSVWGGRDKSGNERGSSLTPSDLSWVTVEKFEIYFSGNGDRTASITSVVLEPWSDSRVNAKLTITRTAAPIGNDYRTATVYLTIPSDFASKYEEIKWDGRTFQF